ncbi:hypothetical protein NLI96_g11073 [Meripilus lineatus]|uniref:Fungal-type protein kinase domain-containing protein n=1 Tax=Meripilus lineatus TaxID=2056292 RepID=A0AAD5UWP9_9APHY|nr:hypothetical protein NLI96_g11073 [Physisporinus lineatus]
MAQNRQRFDWMDGYFVEIKHTDFMNRFCRMGEIPSSTRSQYRSFDGILEEITSEHVTSLRSQLISFLESGLKGEHCEIKPTIISSKSQADNLAFNLAVYINEGPESHLKEIEPALSTSLPDISLARILVPINVEMKRGHNAFGRISSTEFLPANTRSKRSRRRMVEHASKVQRFGHRLHLFSVHIYRRTARLLRWDPSGVVVTKAFDYTENPHLLLDFLHHVSRMDNEQLGFDPTILPVSEVELQIIRNYTPEGHHRAMFNKAFREPSKTQKVIVEGKEFLIGAPQPVRQSVLGRRSKCYVAFDLGRRTLCCMKDSWRLSKDHPEWETYRVLSSHHVPHIATLVAGCDVNQQATITQDIISGNGLDSNWVEGRVHCRVITKEVGGTLTEYENSAELCIFVFRAFEAHTKAWEKAEVLHRNISTENILIIYKDGTKTAILNDWDLCKYKSEMKQPPTALTRSGTWRFKSGLSLKFPRRPYSLADDLESFLHVILYLAMRFHKSAASFIPGDVQQFIQHIYEQRTRVDDTFYTGGLYKLEYNRLGGYPPSILPIVSKGLASLIMNLVGICHMHYKAISDEIDGWFEGDISRQNVKRDSGEDGRVLDNHRGFYEILQAHANQVPVTYCFSRTAVHEDNPSLWPLDDKLEDQYPEATSSSCDLHHYH